VTTEAPLSGTARYPGYIHQVQQSESFVVVAAVTSCMCVKTFRLLRRAGNELYSVFLCHSPPTASLPFFQPLTIAFTGKPHSRRTERRLSTSRFFFLPYQKARCPLRTSPCAATPLVIFGISRSFVVVIALSFAFNFFFFLDSCCRLLSVW
jgi:hypothetical protein